MTKTATQPSVAAPTDNPPVHVRPIESHLHPTPSFDLAAHPVPDPRAEVWRFTPNRRIEPLFEAEGAEQVVDITVEAPDGIRVGELARGEGSRGTALVPIDRPSVLADLGSPQATHIALPADVLLTEPILVKLAGRGLDASGDAHLVIEAGQHAQGIVIIEHTGNARLRENVEVIVGDGARLTVVSIQGWDTAALHAGLHVALVGRDAIYKHINVTLGGDLVRLHSNVEYAGPGGRAELFGFYFTDAGQHQEHRLFVDHNAPKTSSLVDYRGALQGARAHAVWVGDVLIRKVAEGIDSYESNKNLLLTHGCRADSVPNLEIETGEIEGAGHSSSTGHFDDDQLFYLRSRGLSEAEARRLVVQGFFFDIIRKIGVPDIEERLQAVVDAELALLNTEISSTNTAPTNEEN